MSVDPFIDNLVGDLTPRSSMTFRRLEFYTAGLFTAALTIILFTLKIRPDYKEALQTGSLLWKPGIFFLSAVSVVLLLATHSLPGRIVKKVYLLPITIAGTFFGFIFLRMLLTSSAQDFAVAMTDRRAPFCLGIVSVFGGLILTALWHLWVKKSAPENNAKTGMIAGLCSGLIAASAYAFHCGQDNPLYMLIYYGVPIFLLSFIGRNLGKKYLIW